MALSEFPEGHSAAILSINERKIECKLLGVAKEKVRGVAIICHPHPLFGGTMNNKVVHTLARAFEAKDISVLRFNFRGVGRSDGEHAGGMGELADLRGLIAWVESRLPGLPVYLAGFSFGAFVVASYAAEAQRSPASLVRLFLVAPPVHHYNMDKIKSVCCPVTVIFGLEDEVVPAEQMLAWSDRLAEGTSVHTMAAATHFFHGHLTALKKLLVDELALNEVESM